MASSKIVATEEVWGWLTSLIIATGLVLLPLPSWLIDQAYCRAIYPTLQSWITGVTNLVPFSLLDFLILTSVFVFLWWLIGFPAQLLQGTGGEVFQYLSMQSHFYDALNVGNIKLSDLVYFFSLIALGLFMGTTAIETRRWR